MNRPKHPKKSPLQRKLKPNQMSPAALKTLGDRLRADMKANPDSEMAKWMQQGPAKPRP